MKKIYITLAIISAMTLVGCGGGGGTSEGSNSTTIIPITTCDTYTTVVTGDSIVRDSSNTTVKIIDADGSRKICVATGSAHIVRK